MRNLLQQTSIFVAGCPSLPAGELLPLLDKAIETALRVCQLPGHALLRASHNMAKVVGTFVSRGLTLSKLPATEKPITIVCS